MARRKYNTQAERYAAKLARSRTPEEKARRAAYKQRPEVKSRARYQQRLRRMARDNPDKLAEKNKAQEKRRAYTSRPGNRALLLGRQQPDGCEACDAIGETVFDHCHMTGVARGWLCHGCNVTLGRLKDSIPRLRQLIAYLERTRDGTGTQHVIPGL